MTLYRIDWEWEVEDGIGNWVTTKSYEYVAGDARMGRAVYRGVINGQVPVRINKLIFSFRALWICLRNVESETYNQTAHKINH